MNVNLRELAKKLISFIFFRWKFLSLYLLFAGIAMNGWYIDAVGWFSSSEGYVASVKTQYGDINILNVLVFITGSVVFLGYLWADVKTKRLERMIAGDVSIKNQTLFGDVSQAATTGKNSPALNNPQAPVTINYGITEERCRVIFDEKLPIALQSYSVESIVKAKERTYEFRQKLVPRLGQEDKGFENFADPSFLLLLIEAQKAAASTEREADYDLLSELLVNRAKMGTDRSLHMGIKKAVSSLPFISDSQLAGLTIKFCMSMRPLRYRSVAEALSSVNEIYGNIIGDTVLPTGKDWLESLEAGGLVKNVGLSIQSFRPSREMVLESMERFTDTGIMKDSENYKQAINILREVGLPNNMLLEHELNSDYVRLLPLDVSSINDTRLYRKDNGTTVELLLTGAQKDGVRRVFSLYEKEESIKEDFKNRFIEKYNSYPNLQKVFLWWDRDKKISFEQTIVGRILSNANAHKCDARIPIIVR